MIFSGVVSNPESVISREAVPAACRGRGWDLLALTVNLKKALPSSSEPVPCLHT